MPSRSLGTTRWAIVTGARTKEPEAVLADMTADDLKTLVDHARRVRTLMAYVPRKYDHALLEAMAVNGALAPNLNAHAREKAVDRVAQWLDSIDEESGWSGEVAEDGGHRIRLDALGYRWFRVGGLNYAVRRTGP